MSAPDREGTRLAGTWSRALMLLAGVGAAAVAFGLARQPERAWADLLVNQFFFLSLALGAAVFLAIQYLASAGWWVVLRRPAEAFVAYLPLGGLLLLPLYFGRHALWPWSRPEAAADPLTAAKAAYLNTPFFFLRMALFVGLWSLFALLLRRASRRQEAAGGDALAAHRRLVRLSGAFVPVFALTFSLASFDWLMSLDPHWYSTLFAVYVFAGTLLQAIAGLTLAAVLLSERGGPLAGLLRDAHRHDLGRLLFGFSIFWAYIWVCQYLLIWYSNIPEEVTFYVARTRGPWALPFFAVPALQWGVPFLALMTGAAKRRPAVLATVAAAVLAGHWLDLWVLVAPTVTGAPRLGLLELASAAGSAAVFLLIVGRALGRLPLLATQDPYFEESLAHH